MIYIKCTLLKSPYTKTQWKKKVHEKVHKYFEEHIMGLASHYKTIKYLNIKEYKPGKQLHMLFILSVTMRDVNHIPVKLRIISGAYIHCMYM